jgi:thiol-disulfide isomerase/thioredoxin
MRLQQRGRSCPQQQQGDTGRGALTLPGFGCLAVLLLALAPIACPARGETAFQPVTTIPVEPLSLPDLKGAPQPVQRMGSGPTILHFFATWCAPCKEELAGLERLAGEAGDLRIIAISVGEPPIRLRRFFAEAPVSFPVLADEGRAAAKAWDVTVLPTSILLGAKAPPLKAEGELDWSAAEVRARLTNHQ